jgi:hypothetical protein
MPDFDEVVLNFANRSYTMYTEVGGGPELTDALNKLVASYDAEPLRLEQLRHLSKACLEAYHQMRANCCVDLSEKQVAVLERIYEKACKSRF